MPNGEVKGIIEALMRNSNVAFSYLYGSVARGETHRFSDIDIAVYLKDPSVESYMEIVRSLPVTRLEVDLRILNHLPPLLRHKIILEGRLLFVKDREVYERFVYETLVEALEIKSQIEDLRRERLEGYLNAS